ncbi:MAG: SseB family protein [Proteobacteria bacterium]|nr:SseB family protein [Pseudomonadota bacterium]
MNEAGLERLLEQARTSHEAEVRFIRALLNSRVYAHVPLSDDHPRLRLIMFQHPDGFMAIPFFTSLKKAQFANRGAVRIVSTTGRDLLEGSNGAILMLNPNDGGMVLYPEEVSTLLETGFWSRVQREDYSEGPQRYIWPPSDVPTWFIDVLRKVCGTLDMVVSGHLAEMAYTEHATVRSLLIVLQVPRDQGERAARALTLHLQQSGKLEKLNRSLDITIFDPNAEPPNWLESEGFQFYPVLN